MSQTPLQSNHPIHPIANAVEQGAIETGQAMLVAQPEIAPLWPDIDRLTQENQYLKAMLSTTVAQSEQVEAELNQTAAQLQGEIAERQRLEVMFQSLIDALSQEKADLEIIVQTIMEHGDVMDAQWRQKLQETVWLAEMDGLTQIANRRKFDADLTRHWQQMSRDRAPLAMLLCDIDHFKQYNDAQGHLAGDDGLRRVAQALNDAVTRPLDLLSRYGGEEFAVILPQTNAAGAWAVAERMQAAIAALQIPHPTSPVSPYLTVSIGVAVCIPQRHQPTTDLINGADQMLYLAKQQGRNRIVYHAI